MSPKGILIVGPNDVPDDFRPSSLPVSSSSSETTTTPSPNNDDDDDSGSEELEVCELCKREGEVLECDFAGCDKVWHIACVPELQGKVPEGRWTCPAQHSEICELCHLPGFVMLCDVESCGRMYHVDCLPHLRGKVPKGFWECPMCVQDREVGLVCGVCLKSASSNEDGDDNDARAATTSNKKSSSSLAASKYTSDNLVKCITCKEAVHLGCVGSYGAKGQISCAACNFKTMRARASTATMTTRSPSTTKRRKSSSFTSEGAATGRVPKQKISIQFIPGLSALERARILQIARGEAVGLTEDEAFFFLNAGIAKSKKG